MAKSKLKDVVFEGGDEYVIPLLARFVSLRLAGHLDLAIAQFEFEDGVIVRIPISSQALEPLGGALALWQGKREIARSKKHTRH